MLLMFEKGIKVGLMQAVKHYAKANNKYMKNPYILMKRVHIFSIWNQVTLMGGQWSKNF